jgi:hypothetical protein
MKISYRTHPILEKIKNKKLGELPVKEWDYNSLIKFIPSLKKQFENDVNYFQNITFISKPFVSAVKFASDSGKLQKLIYEAMDNINSICGTYIINDFVVCVKMTELSSYSNNGETIIVYVFEKDGTLILNFTQNGKQNISWMCKDFIEGKVFSNYKKIETEKDILGACNIAYLNIVLLEVFKKYATVETKYLKAETTKKELFCKYVNDTKLDILHLDCKWFTTLVKSDGFNVRGHFRLQPCGENRKDRKIIWVEPFEKMGYNSPAKIHSTT